jgi:hypothetical protein
VVIGKNTFFPAVSSQKPRFDTLAHELGHNAGGDHTTFGAGDIANLMTAGANGSGVALRTIPISTTDALTRLGSGEYCTPPANNPNACTADQLNTAAMVTPISQQDEADMSGLLNRIASSSTTASTPAAPAAAATALTVSTAGSTTAITNAPAASKPDTSIVFSVGGADQGAVVGVIITHGPGVKFDPSNKVTFTTNGQLVDEADYANGKQEDRDCALSDTECLIIRLKNPGLVQGKNLVFSQGILLSNGKGEEDDGGGKKKVPVTLSQLNAAGVYVTYLFSDGLVITSQLVPTAGQLTGDSHHPTGVVPTRLDPNPSFKVSNTGAKPCVPNASGLCEDPSATGGQDGDPRCEDPTSGATIGGAAIRRAAVTAPAYPDPYPPLPDSCPLPTIY